MRTSFRTREYVAEAYYPLYSEQFHDAQYLLNKIRFFLQSFPTISYVPSLSSNFSSTQSKCCETSRLLISHNSDIVWLRPFHEAYKTDMFFVYRLIHQPSPSSVCAMLDFNRVSFPTFKALVSLILNDITIPFEIFTTYCEAIYFDNVYGWHCSAFSLCVSLLL